MCVCKPSWHKLFLLNQFWRAVFKQTLELLQTCMNREPRIGQLQLFLWAQPSDATCCPMSSCCAASHTYVLYCSLTHPPLNTKAQSSSIGSSRLTSRPWSLIKKPLYLSSCCGGHTCLLLLPLWISIGIVWNLAYGHALPAAPLSGGEWQLRLIKARSTNQRLVTIWLRWTPTTSADHS